MDVEFENLAQFKQWVRSLSPIERRHVQRRLDLLAKAPHSTILGKPNFRYLGKVLREVRSPHGQRIYFTVARGRVWVLAFGSKGTQTRDIARARRRQR